MSLQRVSFETYFNFLIVIFLDFIHLFHSIVYLYELAFAARGPGLQYM